MLLELLLYMSMATGEYNAYGGWNGIQGDKTGFFHTQEINGVHWLIDPDGYAFISKGVNHVSYTADNAQSLGYSPYGKVTAKKYGNADAWAKASVERLKNWNFNTIGAWSSRETFKQGIPYTVIIDLASGVGGNWQDGSFPDVFSDAFRQSVYKAAKEKCTSFRDDRFLIGYFTDNELRWGADWRSNHGLLTDFWEMPSDSAGKKKVVSFVLEYYGTIEKFNAHFKTDFASFDNVIKETPPLPQTEELKSLESGFLKFVASQYFKVCADAIREYDPNHLILGCRYGGYAPMEVVESMGDNVDVISYNDYGFHPPISKLQQIYELTGKPMMLTEFSFKAMDSGLPNTKGAGLPVKTQQERADNFDTYVTELIKLPYAVGFHWFEYADEPEEGRFDGENSNYGVVNIKDETWETITKRMSDVNTRLEVLHSGK